MSQENVEGVRAQVEAFRVGTSESDRKDMLTKMAEFWDPEIEWDASAGALPDISQVYRGREAVLGFWEEFLAAWATTTFEYELIDAGDAVVMLIEQQMRGRCTDIEVSLGKYAQVARVRNGLIVHWKLYPSQADALDAVGLSD